jgi:hypothetical protein
MRGLYRITGMGKAGRNKQIRHRRAVRSAKQPGDEIIAKEVFSEIEKVAAEAGIAPEWVYAMRKTGMMVTEANMDQCSKKELAEWEAAVEEYRSRKPRV